MKYVIAFGFTCSLLYIKMEKPFNPILGETLQCSFKGCPMYLEQVSHHPPIASLYMVGRGFRMSGNQLRLSQEVSSPKWTYRSIAEQAITPVTS